MKCSAFCFSVVQNKHPVFQSKQVCKRLFMSHLTSESVNDSVACCMFYGTLLSVSLPLQMVTRTGSRSLFARPVDLYIVL
jgi:hypothetical protein